MSTKPCPPLTGIPLPPPALMFMNEKPRAMVHAGFRMVGQLQDWGVLSPADRVLDIGCGYGRLAYGLLAQEHTGAYVGLDILRPQITWLQQHLRPHLPPGSHFIHLDIRNNHYNPNGKIDPKDISFADYAKPDLVTLFSVFTHMYERDIEIYLTALRKICDRQTAVCMTCYMINAEVRELEQAGKSQYPMLHQQSEFCWYFNKDKPLHAIAYDEAWMIALLARLGFVVERAFMGNWCGRTGAVTGQDTLILRTL